MMFLSRSRESRLVRVDGVVQVACCLQEVSSRQDVCRTNKAPIAEPSLVAQPDRLTSLTSIFQPQNTESNKALSDTILIQRVAVILGN